MREFAVEEVLHENRDRRIVRTRLGNRPIIIKSLVDPDYASELQRLKKEFLLLDRVQHPNWPTAIRFQRARMRGYGAAECILLEPAPGVRLDQFECEPGWSLEKLEIARQILSGLDALHRLGFAHLDFNPYQILIHRTGTPPSKQGAAPSVHVTLLDLGLADEFGSKVSPRGTIGFLAPEMLRNERYLVDPKTDLFAFGELFRGLLVGEAPKRRIDTPGGRRPVDLPPEYPSALHTLLKDLLDPNPDRRPQDAVTVWQFLRNTIREESSASMPRRLEGSRGFPFQGRVGEMRRFKERLQASLHSPAGESLTVHLRGESGIGKRRLAYRLAAVAQTAGWRLAEERASEGLLLQQQDSRVRIRIVERNGKTPSRSKDEVMTLDLRTLDEDDLTRMIYGNRVESHDLALEIARGCLGNPGLLASLIEAMPDYLDFAARHLDGLEIARHVVPPRQWTDWLVGFVERCDHPDPELGLTQPETRSTTFHTDPLELLMALALGDGQWPLSELSDALRHPYEESVVRVERWMERGLLRTENRSYAPRTLLWREAILGLPSGLVEDVGGRLLTWFEGASGANARNRLVDIAFRSGQLRRLRAWLSDDLRDKHDRGWYQEELELAARALEVETEDHPLLTVADIRRLLTTGFCLGFDAAKAFPRELADREPFGARSTDEGRLLSAWVALVHVSGERGMEWGDQVRAVRDDAEVAFAWVLLRSRCLQRCKVQSESPLDFVERVSKMDLFLEQPWADRLALLRAATIKTMGRLREAEAIYAELEDRIERWSDVDRAVYLLNYAAARFQRGASSLELLSHAAELLQRLHMWRHLEWVASNRGGESLEAGRLDEAEEASRLGLARSLDGSHGWRTAAYVYNLAYIYTLRGRVAEGLDAARSSRDLARELRDREGVWLAVQLEARLLDRVGRSAHAISILESSSAQIDRNNQEAWIWQTAGLGSAYVGDGRTEEGYRLLAEAADLALDAENISDAASILVDRLELEIARQDPEAALETHGRLRELRDGITPLVEKQIWMLEGEMAGLGWTRQNDEDVQNMLLSVIEDETCNELWGVWRCYWRFAQVLLRRRETQDLSRAMYVEARRRFHGQVTLIHELQMIESFLSLPPQMAFLDEL